MLVEYMIPMKSTTIAQGEHVFFDIYVKGGKRCGMDATVGGLRRIVQPFRVAINAKGGDCWHVYRKSVLVIDGKNNNEPNL